MNFKYTFLIILLSNFLIFSVAYSINSDEENYTENELSEDEEIPYTKKHSQSSACIKKSLINHIKNIPDNYKTYNDQDWQKRIKELKPIWDPNTEKTLSGFRSALVNIRKKNTKDKEEQKLAQLIKICNKLINKKKHEELKEKENPPLILSLETIKKHFPKTPSIYNEDNWNSLAKHIKKIYDSDKKRTYLEFYFALHKLLKKTNHPQQTEILKNLMFAYQRIIKLSQVSTSILNISNKEKVPTTPILESISFPKQDNNSNINTHSSPIHNPTSIEKHIAINSPQNVLKRKRKEENEEKNKKYRIDNEESEKLIIKGKNYLKKNDKKNAILCFKETFLLSKNQPISLHFIKACVGLGDCHYDDFSILNDYTNNQINISYDWHIYALETLKNTNIDDIKIHAQILIGLGNARNLNKQYIQKYTGYNSTIGNAAWFLEALDLLSNQKNTPLYIKALIGLGRTQYTNEHNIEKYTGYNANIGYIAWHLEALYRLEKLPNEVKLRAQPLIALGQTGYTNGNNIIKYTNYDENVGQAAWFLEALDTLANEIYTTSLWAQALIGLGNANYNNKTEIKKRTGYDPNYLNAAWFFEALYILHNKNKKLRIQCYIAIGERLSDKKACFYDLDKAINYYQDALNLNPDPELRSKTLKRLGDTYGKKRDNFKADDYYKEALHLNPSPRWAEKIRNSMHYNAKFIKNNIR